MTILFLDFDGVLSKKFIGAQPFSCAEQLWRILRACQDVVVVFSTSWRELHKQEELVAFVACGGGEDLVDRFIGQTPRIKVKADHDPRHLEIQRWRDTNKHTGHWLALDDQLELFHGGHPNLYLVNGDTGLTEADVEAIIQLIKSGKTEAQWQHQIIYNINRMAVDEDYRKFIAKDLS